MHAMLLVRGFKPDEPGLLLVGPLVGDEAERVLEVDAVFAVFGMTLVDNGIACETALHLAEQWLAAVFNGETHRGEGDRLTLIVVGGCSEDTKVRCLGLLGGAHATNVLFHLL